MKMNFSNSDEILVRRICSGCYGNKVVTDATGNQTQCPTCNGEGKVIKEGGTVDQLADVLMRIMPEKGEYLQVIVVTGSAWLPHLEVLQKSPGEETVFYA
jgi:hypothetical protein